MGIGSILRDASVTRAGKERKIITVFYFEVTTGNLFVYWKTSPIQSLGTLHVNLQY